MCNDNIDQFINLFYDSEYAFTKNSLICIHSKTETAKSLQYPVKKNPSLKEIIKVPIYDSLFPPTLLFCHHDNSSFLIKEIVMHYLMILTQVLIE